MNDILVLICCHKECELPKDDYFFPIHVGAKISNISLGFQRDDKLNGIDTDNISDKNPNYCELTAIYWAWKNLTKIYPNVKYIGISHYRRYFIKPNKKQTVFLNTGGILIPNLKYYPYSIENAYCIEHERFDIEVLKNTIIDLYPDYKEITNEVFRGNKTTVCNMFIANKDFYNSYCEWLFSILFEVEKRVHIENYDDYQKRIFGFMAERLLYVYILQNNIKYKTINVKTVGITEFKGLHKLIHHIRCRLAFFIGAKRHY